MDQNRISIVYPWATVQRHPGHGAQDPHGFRYGAGAAGRASQRLSGKMKREYQKRHGERRGMANKMIATKMGTSPAALRSMEKKNPTQARRIRREGIKRLKRDVADMKKTYNKMKKVKRQIDAHERRGEPVPDHVKAAAKRVGYNKKNYSQQDDAIRNAENAIKYGGYLDSDGE